MSYDGELQIMYLCRDKFDPNYPTMEKKHWYVVKTLSRAEKKLNAHLKKEGVESYLPLQKTLRIWSDRKKRVELPLIPSTLFVYTSAKELTQLYNYPGVHSILSYLGKPAVVRDHEIQNLKILLQETHEKALEASVRLCKGDSVRVTRGPFQGLQGIALETPQKFRVVVELESLGTGFSVNIPKSYVRAEAM